MDAQEIKSQEAISFMRKLDELLEAVKRTLLNRKPHLNGETYLSREDVCKILHISQRTLQEYRDSGKLGYIQISGKILYKESEVLKLLEDNYCG